MQSRGEAAAFALITVMLPAVMYTVGHLPILTHGRIHLWALLLIISLPLLVITGLRNGLWWAGLDEDTELITRFGLGVLGVVGLVLGVEGRVIFFAFGHYIKLPPGWDWLFVTAALAGLAVLVYGHMAGRNRAGRGPVGAGLGFNGGGGNYVAGCGVLGVAVLMG